MHPGSFPILTLWCPQDGWMSTGPSMQSTVPLQGLASQHQCEGESVMMYMLNVILLNVSSRCIAYVGIS